MPGRFTGRSETQLRSELRAVHCQHEQQRPLYLREGTPLLLNRRLALP
jgi:DNA-binding GntR family transcriptional regulator